MRKRLVISLRRNLHLLMMKTVMEKMMRMRTMMRRKMKRSSLGPAKKKPDWRLRGRH